jgi:hypothetical protein
MGLRGKDVYVLMADVINPRICKVNEYFNCHKIESVVVVFIDEP